MGHGYKTMSMRRQSVPRKHFRDDARGATPDTYKFPSNDGPRDAGCRSRSPSPRRGSTRTFWSDRYGRKARAGEEEEGGVAAAAAYAARAHHSLARSLFGRFILLCHYSSCGRCGEETGRKKEGSKEGIRVSVRDMRTERESESGTVNQGGGATLLKAALLLYPAARAGKRRCTCQSVDS